MDENQTTAVPPRPVPPRTVHILIDSVRVSAPQNTDASLGSHWQKLARTLDLVAKLLPGFVILVAIVSFKTEIADFLRHAAKVEVLGFKLEKATFATRLQESAKAAVLPTQSPRWTEVPFRKLKLAGPTLLGLRLLWVDDHPENNFYLRRILGDLGVRISIALNNGEALNEIKRGDFEIIISDFGRDAPLSETGGELATRLTAMGYRVPILFYTADPAKVPDSVPRELVTNDPALLLSEVAELAIARP